MNVNDLVLPMQRDLVGACWRWCGDVNIEILNAGLLTGARRERDGKAGIVVLNLDCDSGREGFCHAANYRFTRSITSTQSCGDGTFFLNVATPLLVPWSNFRPVAGSQ